MFVRGKTASIPKGKRGKCTNIMQYAMEYLGTQRRYVPWKPWVEETVSEDLPLLKHSYSYCSDCHVHYDPQRHGAVITDKCRTKGCDRRPLLRARACEMVIEPQQWTGVALEIPTELREDAERAFAAETSSVLSAETASEILAHDFGRSLIGESELSSAPGTPRDEGVAVAASGVLHPDTQAAMSRWREKEAQDRVQSQRIFMDLTWRDHMARQAKEAEEKE